MATIYDVAKAAGVSPKTVSRVMNDDGPVRESTRKAVLTAMRDLGYVPSTAARAIKSNKSGLIGLITGAISARLDAEDAGGLPDLFIVQGIQSVISRSGKTLMIADTGGDLDRVEALTRTFREHRVEGLFYVADRHQKVDLPLPSDGCQTVLVNCYDQRGTLSVLPDDRSGQRELTAALIGDGHRRIAMVTLDAGLDATVLRLAGYRDALTAAGIEADPALIRGTAHYGTPAERELIRTAVDDLLELPDPPSVIACGNDRLAMMVFDHLRQRGLAIPGDVSVAGYDDHRQIAKTLEPALTTVELPYRAMGERAASLLLEHITAPSAAPRCAPILVSGALRQRQSVAPVSVNSNQWRKTA